MMNTIREKQLEIITEKCNSAKNKFEVLILKGETGIGKTFLIESFLDSYKNQEVLISSSLCNYQTGKYEPYLPFKQLLKGLLNIHIDKNAEGDTSHFFEKVLVKSVTTLVDVAPDLINTFVPSGSILTKIGSTLFKDVNVKAVIEDKFNNTKTNDLQIEEGKIHKQYLNFLRSLSQESPLILILEDIQWLDEASMNLLLPLTQMLQDCPILLIASYRGNEINQQTNIFPILNELKRNLGNIELDMDLKNDVNKLSMINSILNENKNELDDNFRQKLLSITNGNPMFTNELIQSLQETGQITSNSDGVLESNDNLNWSEIPEKLEAVVLGRLSKLEDDTRSLLSSASVQGSSFLVQVLGKIDHIDDRDLLKTFARSLIKKHHLLKEGKVQRLNKQVLSYFHFSSGLIQHYLYNDLMYSERMLYHQEIAEALIELFKNEYDQANALIAYHFEKSEIPDKAVLYYESAGNDSIKLSALKEAVLLYDKALSLIDDLIEEDELLWEPVKLRLLVEKSVALKPTEGWIGQKVIDLYAQAYEIGTRLNDNETLAPVTFGIWVQHLLNLELNDALKYAHSYQETAEKMEDTEIIIEAAITFCNTYFWMGDIKQTVEYADFVLNNFHNNLHEDHIHKFGQDPRAFAYLFKILSLSLTSQKQLAYELADKALLWAKSLKHPFTEVIILQAIVWLYFQEGEFHKMKETGSNLIDIATKYDFIFYLGIGQIFSACWLLEEEKYDEALDILHIGFYDNIGKNGSIVFHSIFHLLKSKIEYAQQHYENSLETINRAIEVSEQKNELIYFSLLLQQKATILLKQKNVEEAETMLNKANVFSKEKNMQLFTRNKTTDTLTSLP